MFELIATQDELDALLVSAAAADRYAIDTEFHREKTYYPQIALIQLAWEDRVVFNRPACRRSSALCSAIKRRRAMYPSRWDSRSRSS